MTQVRASNLGYPRIGEKREWKRTLEAFWANKIDETTFMQDIEAIGLQQLSVQKELGVDLIPSNTYSWYDQVLDTSTMFGIVPARFGYKGGHVSTDIYFSMARGNADAVACEMTKWFNTNYHYIVPELNDVEPQLTVNRPLEAYRQAKQKLGLETKPVLIGPYTYVRLAKGYEENQFASWVDKLLPLYERIVSELQAEGVQWVQIDEPSLVGDVPAEHVAIIQNAYERLHTAAPQLNVMLQTYFEAVDHYEAIVSLPVQGVGLDFVHGAEGNLNSLSQHGFPQDKVLGVGIIDGRNIWRANLVAKLSLLESIQAAAPSSELFIQPSCSLLHSPVTVAHETMLDELLKDNLSFANEKLTEIQLLTTALQNGEATSQDVLDKIKATEAVTKQLNESDSRRNPERADELLSQYKIKRSTPFAARNKLQQERFGLPKLPTTTIGSFPQTIEVRRARRQWRKGDLSEAQYDEFIKEQIKEWIDIQEEIGIDVLVHGEFERTDMVEYFGEKLAGFAFTSNGWVQSYGSRCVKPPVIYGNVDFVEPMTVKETVYAQSLTEKPVKGMLTGPVTILNWSFVRDDITRRDVAMQIAVALSKEVEALEEAGIAMIQVDEPAIREGLPLKDKDKQDYIDWSVNAFLLSTSNVEDTTQIHTHMCYSDFNEMIDPIKALDADVISIESSRSHGEIIEAFETNVYDKGIGLGVYDIHSPRIPLQEEIDKMIARALRVLPSDLFWINPDCGLKTRGKPETVEALRIMVERAKVAREAL